MQDELQTPHVSQNWPVRATAIFLTDVSLCRSIPRTRTTLDIARFNYGYGGQSKAARTQAAVLSWPAKFPKQQSSIILTWFWLALGYENTFSEMKQDHNDHPDIEVSVHREGLLPISDPVSDLLLGYLSVKHLDAIKLIIDRVTFASTRISSLQSISSQPALLYKSCAYSRDLLPPKGNVALNTQLSSHVFRVFGSQACLQW